MTANFDAEPRSPAPRTAKTGRLGAAGRAAALVLAAAVGACAPRIEPPGPPVAKPALGAETFVAADGMAAPVRRWLPDAGPVKASVIALHGFNDYSRFFQGAGLYLADRGYAVYAYDQRGFGRAGTPGLWPGTEALADDLKAVAGAVRARHPGRPSYLIGASMGAAVIMVTMASADAPPVDGVVLSAPAVWGRATMALHQRAALWIAAHTLPWLKLTGQGLNIRASDNTDMLRALGRDPLVIKRTRIDAIWGLVELMDSALASSAALPGPTLILLGANDEVIPDKSFRDMVRRLAPTEGDRRRLAFYEGGWHMLLRDLQAETVWADIAAWLDDTSAPLPSGADARAAKLGAEVRGR
ncbi:MAG TPA: alpha/beta hydrolase [Rhodospirillales bacterium]|nr:alpha/beta hydrolase [Rhodospirillales bacterium]HJO69666.1 alpha/beta hydrolase [Rhodospirillales bacterium]